MRSNKIILLDNKTNHNKAIEVIRSEGGRVVHDFGGRLIGAYIPDPQEKVILQKLPSGSKISPFDRDITNELPALDPSESLAVDALRVRSSSKFKSARASRKPPGESPEEQAILSASCTAGEQLGE